MSLQRTVCDCRLKYLQVVTALFNITFLEVQWIGLRKLKVQGWQWVKLRPCVIPFLFAWFTTKSHLCLIISPTRFFSFSIYFWGDTPRRSIAKSILDTLMAVRLKVLGPFSYLVSWNKMGDLWSAVHHYTRHIATQNQRELVAAASRWRQIPS